MAIGVEGPTVAPRNDNDVAVSGPLRLPPQVRALDVEPSPREIQRGCVLPIALRGHATKTSWYPLMAPTMMACAAVSRILEGKSARRHAAVVTIIHVGMTIPSSLDRGRLDDGARRSEYAAGPFVGHVPRRRALSSARWPNRGRPLSIRRDVSGRSS